MHARICMFQSPLDLFQRRLHAAVSSTIEMVWAAQHTGRVRYVLGLGGSEPLGSVDPTKLGETPSRSNNVCRRNADFSLKRYCAEVGWPVIRLVFDLRNGSEVKVLCVNFYTWIVSPVTH